MNVIASSNSAYVQSQALPQLPAPAGTKGAVHWIRTNLFSSPLNTILTLIALYIIATTIPAFVKFYVIDAVWTGSDRDACLRDKIGREVGACWAFVVDRYRYFIYGSYPVDQRWRVNIIFAAFLISIFWILWEKAPARSVGLFFFFGVLPVTAWMLLYGGARSEFWYMVIGAALFAWAIYGNVIAMRKGETGVFTRLDSLLKFGILAGMLVFGLAVGGQGLPVVETGLWGGILVTLLIASAGIVFSLPLGIALALGRRSKLPIIKMFSVIFIEFVRGVPLITVLFMANVMLPLFVPAEWSPDRLLRPLIGVALFAAAYMAEVVRGGLQAIPKGQYEGAMSLGLGYGQMMRFIVLPQALRIVIPGIVNTFIGLFKDTTLVTIIGIFDFMKTIEASLVDPEWATPTTRATGYAFAAIFYFICCWGMSRYSISVERKLAAGQKR
ncbi:MAG: amino acid ABC transporter permease [Bosea sp.]|jgi:general L-amino acid transport system permease protein|nr:amino acid ABC transporter permease [Bosea sp. (in: a-proteobacteria)]